MKLLVLTPEPVDADLLRSVLGEEVEGASHPEGDRDYREDNDLADAEQRFGVPLTHALIER